jgi:ComF family protein
MAQSYFNRLNLSTILADFVGLIYPRVCVGCHEVLYRHEDTLCTHCHIELPHTHFENQPNNPVARLFWGKINFETATSSYFFSKKSRIQQIIHSFKYKNRPEIAEYMGHLMGKKLMSIHQRLPFEVIIPVPLHPVKKRLRGYNQAEHLAMGISEEMNVPLDVKSIQRITANKTQTNRSLYDRWTNVNSIFELRSNHTLSGKHVLIVDDVITSGATIESCAQCILTIPKIKISIASLALATG